MAEQPTRVPSMATPAPEPKAGRAPGTLEDFGARLKALEQIDLRAVREFMQRSEERLSAAEAGHVAGDRLARSIDRDGVIHEQERRDGRWRTYRTINRRTRTITLLNGWTQTTADDLPSPQ